MFNIDLAIKFGSNEIIIFRKGFGIIAKQPAYLAVEEKNNKIKVKATGKLAEKLFYSSSKDITVYQPIENSEIINEKMAIILISEILKDVITDKFFLNQISAIVAVPCALNENQLMLLKKVLLSSGISKIIFVQNSVAVRANFEFEPNSNIMVVDIGKYITDISVLTDDSFNFGRMYFIGGTNMDQSLTTFIMDNHNLEVSDMTSEAIKNEVATLYSRDSYKTEYIGINDAGKFEKHPISANEVRVAIVNVYNNIIKIIKDCIASLDKSIQADIYKNGIVFVGGGSQITGLYEFLSKQLDLPIIIPDEPADNVILGAGKLLSKGKDFLKIEL